MPRSELPRWPTIEALTAAGDGLGAQATALAELTPGFDRRCPRGATEAKGAHDHVYRTEALQLGVTSGDGFGEKER